jgi:DNA primase
MGRIAESTIVELNNRIDAVSVVGDYVKLEKKGGRWWGCCPFHQEKTPSFTVDPDRKTWYCFGCHSGGGIVGFVMEQDKLSFPEAVELLAKRFQVPLIREDSPFPVNTGENERKKDDLADLYRRAAGSFAYILTKTPEGKETLDYVRRRAVSDGMIARFELGLAPAKPFWLHQFLLKKGYSEKFLEESGLFTRANPKRAFFVDRLVFPIKDRQGRIVAFGGRILHGEGPKYLNSGESILYKKRETLFAIDLALNEIKKTKEAVICEGYMDVIALHEAGITNAVAPLGTAFTEEQARLLGRWVDTVKLLFDSDTAGKSATLKAILTCRAAGLSCRVISYEQGGAASFKDPADILKDEGREALNNFIKHDILDFEYLSAESRRSFDGSDSRGKAKAIALLFPFLNLIDSEIERESYFRSIADTFGTDPQLVLNDYKVWHKGGAKPTQNTENVNMRSLQMTEELYLLTAVAVNCGTNLALWTKLRSTIPFEEFEDLNARELYVTLEECDREETFSLEALLSKIDQQALKQFVTEKSLTREFSERQELIVDDGIRLVKVKHLMRKRGALVVQMRMADSDSNLLEDLIHEKMYIDAELQRLKGVNQ